MRIDELKPAPGSRHRRKIVGRGIGSGHGAQSTRGMKGQKSRSGDGKMVGFEGGQIPLVRRIPKRGFRNTVFQTVYAVVNLDALQRHFAGVSEITPEILRERGLIKRGALVKILGDGELKAALTIKAHAFSAGAKTKIEKAGGRTELVKA